MDLFERRACNARALRTRLLGGFVGKVGDHLLTRFEVAGQDLCRATVSRAEPDIMWFERLAVLGPDATAIQAVKRRRRGWRVFLDVVGRDEAQRGIRYQQCIPDR